MALINFLSLEEIRNKILNKWLQQEPNANVAQDSQIYMDSDAIAAAIFSIQMDAYSLAEESFIAFATEDRLSNLGLERGFPRKEATKATGEVTFSRATKSNQDFPISTGTEISTQPAADGTFVSFLTDTDVTLIGTLDPPSSLGISTALIGGTLPDASTYYYKVTARDQLDQETDASVEVSITTGSGGNTNVNTLTWNAEVGVKDYRIYVGATLGSETLLGISITPIYSHISGIGDGINSPPATNSTGATSITVDITAKEAGANGNVPVGAITRFVDQPAGIEEVTNSETTTGGANVENDTDYRERIQRAFIFGSATSKTTTTGYEQTALGVSGVTTAVVVSNPDPMKKNEFDIYITSSETTTGIPSATLIALVQIEVNDDDNRSPNDIITVRGPTPVTVDVTTTIDEFESGFTDQAAVRAEVKLNVQAFLNGLPTGEEVKLVDVANSIHDTAGVKDFTITVPVGNTAIGVTQKAIPGSITIL
jgi:uncharacterized phage protein gp47/JayE